VLYSCGDDIDAAVRRLSELRLRPDGTAVIGKGGGGGGEDENGRVEVVAAAAAAAAASGRATPELIAPFGPEAAAAAAARSGGASPGAAASDAAAERKSASIENNNNASGAAGPKSDPSTSAAAASATPAEVDAWAEGLVREMAAASDVGDAKARASTVLRGFESALLHRVAAAAAAAEAEEASPSNNSNASNVASAAATAARAAALERDCSLLKRAVALQASRLQGAAQARQHESLALTRALQEARARVQQLELSNFALAAHLRAATEGGLGGVNGAGNNNHGGGNGGGGGGMMMNGGGGGGFASPNRDVY
jgi:trimeric autotransporter adhesin